MLLKSLFNNLLCLLAVIPHADNSGRFDSLGGTYDEQTNKAFGKMLYYEARQRSIVGKLSRVGTGGARNVAEMTAGSDKLTLEGSTAIAQTKITKGDEVKYTLQRHAKGVASYGDNPVLRGDFLKYLNHRCFVNQIDSPAIPVQGRMAQQRARESIDNIPNAVREEVIIWAEEQTEFEFLYSLHAGASMSAMASLANGGLAVTLGVNSTGTAGRQLAPRHVYTPVDGWLTYSTTPATWNTTVNNAINTLGTQRITLPVLKVLRKGLDARKFQPIRMGNTYYKSINLCDSDLWYRIDHLLDQYNLQAKPRERGVNPVFGVDHVLEYLGMLFVNVPNLDKYRPAYNGTNGYCDLGPGLTEDPRDYTTSSNISAMFMIGKKAVSEGYNDYIDVTEETGAHKKGMEIAAHMDLAYSRCDWFAKDGSTDVDSVYNDSCAMALFYEDGVGQGY